MRQHGMWWAFLTMFLIRPGLVQAKTPLERLKEIVSINSGSANVEGVLAVQKKIRPWFEELGFEVVLKENPEGSEKSAPMLIGTLVGKSPRSITLTMHADTVFEPSSPFQKWIMKDESLMNGPGVMDDKGGIIVALEALEIYLSGLKSRNEKPRYTLIVEVTPNEEVGALGWEKTFRELSEQSDLVIGLEPAYRKGIVEGRKGNVWFEIEVTGKEAHAGVNHRLGVNACNLLAKKMVELEKLTDYPKNVTVSVGRIEGGQDKYNIVCGWAKAKMDSRVPDAAARDRLVKAVGRILKDPAIRFKITDETVPMAARPLSRPWTQKVLEWIRQEEGGSPEAHISGGVGDVNHYAREGLVVMDGLGPVGDHMHTPEEFIDLRTIPTRARVLARLLEEFGSKGP